MIKSMMLWCVYVFCMGLEKRISEVLMMQGIVFCESEMWHRCVASSPGALELHITKPNYQVKIWLRADYVIIDLENKPTETIDLWQEGTD